MYFSTVEPDLYVTLYISVCFFWLPPVDCMWIDL